MTERPGDDPDREADGAHRRGQDQRRADDREVVHDRRDGGRREPAAALRTLVATAPSASRIGLSTMIRVSSTVRAVVSRSKPLVKIGTSRSAVRKTMTPSTTSATEHEVGDRRDDPPGPPLAIGREQARHDRDQRRRQGARGDELEDQVRDPERGEEGVELGGGAERRCR